ncbi:acyl-CoA carboxylase subunit beta [Nocardia cyriacigeorgica]|uniref:Probable propionyl-CoA carboxylase beta chain 5 n=1 Tax=Nocardia cyriacigeorgica TaxID=135487 RepID=A0A4U8W3F5_9NOCA|nr:acyl-CoA carboxylase subunit beta [Nocardia cyriacigeorgica]MBF6100999.1 acyl-CoA carboxylase subunit beta [Nocardia cyriacigeorgica]MBF6162849.1 acyl-CoA carboxylase subunit beta [Nocardia cyriacigeorgica]MBF6201851.1 acyl-CoA carboxylase subunit beta [Nocardia cyriacigeorgica]MBF6515726.1 acyl-CoA carboxylase subunit beta [Nocardia cyriacigeorgica]VFB00671.1 Probable propionyl-CoA carboxylase beta chain 5 [Nocardia cyriacigeorgica]
MSTTAEKLADLRKRLELAQEPAGEAGVAKRAKKGIPSARDRINMLLDPGTFVEVGALVRKPGDPEALYGDGVVTGHGLVDGRPVAVFSHDQTVYGGSVGEMFGRKVAGIMEYAHKVGCPVVGINDSGGARVQEAVTSLAWYAELGRRQEPLSGLVPQISMILGKCAGGAVYAPINTDVVVATREAYMFVTGPKVIREVTGEDVSLEELGGANSQAQYGNIHHVAEDEKAAFQWVRDYLGFLPTSCQEEPPIVNPGLEPETTETDLELNGIVPDSDNAGYDMHEILVRIFDDGAFHEVGETAGRNIITGFARVDGRSVGVVANQPMVYAGALDARASDKAAHFVRMCDAFEIPLVFVVDTPGFLPGVEQEKIGVIKRGGRFLFSFVEATVPKVTVVIRKSYGGGYAVMGSKQLGADVNLAWPTARIAVMGAESAVSLIGGKQIAAAPEEQRPAIRQQMIDFYNATVATPWVAAERGYIDAVIEPSATRLELRKALQLLRDKTILRSPRKHHLLPL